MGRHKSRRSRCMILAVLDGISAFSSETSQEINANDGHNNKKIKIKFVPLERMPLSFLPTAHFTLLEPTGQRKLQREGRI